MKKLLCILLSVLLMPVLVQASPWKEHLNALWDSKEYDLMVPANVWHNRLAYPQYKIDDFNERPWGIGLGKRYYDEDKDLHALATMIFLDSHKDPEPLMGYQFQKKWYYGDTRDFSLGLGYSMGLTARSDYSWIPFPYIAPIFGLQYKNISLENTYIPGGRGYGNILFTWLRIEF